MRIAIPRLFAPTAALALGFLLPPFTTTLQAQDARVEAAVAGLEWREIGPAIMGGRISDLAVVESNPAIFFIGTATGGVWKTTNHGTSWEPLFDDQSTSSIGDVTLGPSNPNLLWVGSGEPQNRQSSPWGNGAYKSLDGGRSWKHMGLEDTRHISRIHIHPGNPDVVYVAAVGHLWGPNEERGVFKTIDGGSTWQKVLYIDENTGAIDLAMDPGDPETLFAAMYQRRRTNFGFNGGGPGSGIYRTTDGGATWTELTNGLPESDLGRIGLDIYRKDGNLIYASVEADRAGGFGRGGGGFGGNQPAGDRKTGLYRSTDRGETWTRVSQTNPRPMYFSQVRIDPNDPERIYMGGVQLMISDDGGKTFSPERTVHSDHHALWIDPANSNHLIMGSDGGVSTSWDKGKLWRMYDNLSLGQFYEIGFDLRDPYYVCGGLQDNGSWCGPNKTLSNQGIRNRDWYNIGGGDGFYSVPDPTDHRIVFGESQGGNVYRADVLTGERQQIRPSRETTDDDDEDYRWNWNTPVVMSRHDPSTIYLGANLVLKSTDRGYTWEEISPDLTRQVDRSELPIMDVLPTDDMLSRHDGISSYGNLTTLSESPINPSVLYAGTDDGNIQGTRDGGSSWQDLTANVPDLPEQTYVSRVVASRFAEGTVYATFDGHTNDDYKPYVYVSRDYGDRWESITSGLPEWSVNVIAEHPRTASLLLLGNEVGAHFSIDGGAQWHSLSGNLPTVPVDDIKVHPRENDLLLGTHGRGVWILDDIAPLEQLSQEVMASAAHLFTSRPVTVYNQYRPQGWNPGVYEAENPPYGSKIRYYLRDDLGTADEMVTDQGQGQGQGGPLADGRGRAAGGGKATITILDAAGTEVRTLEGAGEGGVHEVVWDLRLAPPYEPEEEPQGRFGAPRGPTVMPGTYTIRLEAGEQERTEQLVVNADSRIDISHADRQARQDAMLSMYRLAKPSYEAGQTVRRLTQQVSTIQRMLRDHDSVPENVTTAVDTLESDLRDLGRRANQSNRLLRTSFAIEGSTARPTAVQLRQIDKAWEDIPGLIDEINDMVTDRLPALNRQLDEHGLRPTPGEPIAVPSRGSNR